MQFEYNDKHLAPAKLLIKVYFNFTKVNYINVSLHHKHNLYSYSIFLPITYAYKLTLNHDLRFACSYVIFTTYSLPYMIYNKDTILGIFISNFLYIYKTDI